MKVEELRRQFNRARDMGWLKHFQEAAEVYGFPVEVLMGIASRETNLDPIWLTKPGDNGNGFGLMQVDAGTDREFARSGKWKDARLGILRGTEILAEKMQRVKKLLAAGEVSVRDRSGRGYKVEFVPDDFKEDDRTVLEISVAAYNSGDWAVYHFIKRRDPDRGTTGADYAEDVMGRAAEFKKLIPLSGTYTMSVTAIREGSGSSGTAGASPVRVTIPSSVAISGTIPATWPVTATSNANLTTGSGSVVMEKAKPDVLTVATSSAKALWETITAGSSVTVLAALGYLRDNPMYAIYLGVAIIAITVIFYVRQVRHTRLDSIVLESAADPNKQTVERK